MILKPEFISLQIEQQRELILQVKRLSIIYYQSFCSLNIETNENRTHMGSITELLLFSSYSLEISRALDKESVVTLERLEVQFQ